MEKKKRSKARHRPKRQYPKAKRKLCQPEIKSCPYCESKLKSTRTLYIDKDVQTIKEGPVNVRAYGYYCPNGKCPHPEKRYRAVKEVLQVSLPHGTYGLDVIAFIGWQHEREKRQFKEIQGLLEKGEIEISERHVGRLYRQYLALMAGMNEEKMDRLKETEQEYGGVIWAMDGLQPDKNGPQMYVLYEVLNGEVVAAAWFDKRDRAHLQGWLEPYGELDLNVLATLSDGEEAERAAMEAVWPGKPNQMCHVHFLGDIALPIQKGDRQLRTKLGESFGKLPPVPGNEVTAKAGPKARTLELNLATISETEKKAEESQGQRGGQRAKVVPSTSTEFALNRPQGQALSEAEISEPVESATVSETKPDGTSQQEIVVQMTELGHQFRTAFQDALHRSSRKPSKLGGLAGYDQLQSLVTVLQAQLPPDETGILRTLLEQGQRALWETAELANDVRCAQSYLQQLTHLLAAPLKTEQNQQDPPSPTCSTEAEISPGAQVKQDLADKLTILENQADNGPITLAFLANTRRLSTKWEAYLFNCYNIPGLPTSNTALEARFSDLRRGHRRVTGRKETSSLRRTAHFQILWRASSMSELCQRLGEVSLTAYQAARERLEAAEEKQRWLYRLHRWPTKTAMDMVIQYLALRHQRHSAQPAGP
jgi:hypothetical protein